MFKFNALHRFQCERTDSRYYVFSRQPFQSSCFTFKGSQNIKHKVLLVSGSLGVYGLLAAGDIEHEADSDTHLGYSCTEL